MPPKDAALPQVGQSDELSYGGLKDILGFRLRMAHTAMYRDFSAALGGLGLTQKQSATLWLIDANPGASQAALAAALSMDRATMMAIIDRLEESGLVIRKRSAQDRRRQELYLTPAGQKVLTKARTAIAKHERRFTSRLTPQELDALFKALSKLSAEE
jgi:DNA-binding MarR family transcriptional regulator